jgi:hypothetical protein
MDVQSARRGQIVEDEDSNTFEVLGHDTKPGCLELQSVATKEIYSNVDARLVTLVEGLRAR